jgi:hypothetical protein
MRREELGPIDLSREELVAEFTSSYLCAEVGIEPATIENTAAYIEGWSRVLKYDRRVLVVAAGAAQRAADHILDRQLVRASEDRAAERRRERGEKVDAGRDHVGGEAALTINEGHHPRNLMRCAAQQLERYGDVELSVQASRFHAADPRDGCGHTRRAVPPLRGLPALGDARIRAPDSARQAVLFLREGVERAVDDDHSGPTAGATQRTLAASAGGLVRSNQPRPAPRELLMSPCCPPRLTDACSSRSQTMIWPPIGINE